MKYYGDYHTHTIYSHGKGTIAENAAEAAKKGFKEIAVTDHGFRHVIHHVSRRSVPDMQRDVKESSEQYGIKVLLGLETNITGMGRIDIKPSDYEILDLVLCGFHRFVVPWKPRDFFHLARVTLFNERKMISRNTDLYLSVIEKHEIDVITHLNLNMRVDCERIAKACKDAGTMIELNGKRIAFPDDDFRAMVETGVQFIVNSDAHSPGRVGGFDAALRLLDRIPCPGDKLRT